MPCTSPNTGTVSSTGTRTSTLAPMDSPACRSPATQRVIQSTSKLTPSTSRNLSICPFLQRRSALQPDKTRPGHPCTTPYRTEESIVDRRSTTLHQPFQPARDASRPSALGFSCRHTAVSASSDPPGTASESPWHRADEGARPQLRLVSKNRPRHREVRPRMQQLPTSANTAVQHTFLSVVMVPARPWQRVHVDFAGPFLGSMLLLLVDARSKWPEVFPMESTTATKTVECVRTIFARNGLPEHVQLVSDNGPQFVMDSSKTSCKVTTSNKSAPYHPSTNGLFERFIHTCKHVMRASETSVSLNERPQRFLLTY